MPIHDLSPLLCEPEGVSEKAQDVVGSVSHLISSVVLLGKRKQSGAAPDLPLQNHLVLPLMLLFQSV